MSTRGMIGFVIDGEVKATYNHSDSYPDYLGAQVLFWTRGTTGRIEQAMAEVRRLRLVADERDPVPNPLGYRLAELLDTHVGGPTGTVWPDNPAFEKWSVAAPSWYQVLRGTQGDLNAIVRSGYMEDGGAAFALDSLFCEWGYLVNFDDQVLEVYGGFTPPRTAVGRFAGLVTDAAYAEQRDRYKGAPEYDAITLLTTYAFGDLPTEARFLDDVAAIDNERRGRDDDAA